MFKKDKKSAAFFIDEEDYEEIYENLIIKEEEPVVEAPKVKKPEETAYNFETKSLTTKPASKWHLSIYYDATQNYSIRWIIQFKLDSYIKERPRLLGGSYDYKWANHLETITFYASNRTQAINIASNFGEKFKIWCEFLEASKVNISWQEDQPWDENLFERLKNYAN